MAKEKDSGVYTTRMKIGSVFATGFFAILCAIILFPVFAGLLASFRPGTELIRRGLAINLDFSTMTLDNYKYLFGNNADGKKYFMWYKNSLVITIATVILTLFVCYFIAYGLSMYEYKLKNVLFFIVIATMMVPFEILMIPMYKEMIAINLIDTYAGVVLPGICGASTIFFFRQYMQGLPKELLDAARIDGATEYGICVRIMLPITKPAFAAMRLSRFHIPIMMLKWLTVSLIIPAEVRWEQISKTEKATVVRTIPGVL